MELLGFVQKYVLQIHWRSFLIFKSLGIGQNKINFKIIIAGIAVGRIGSSPVSSCSNYSSVKSEKVGNSVTCTFYNW